MGHVRDARSEKSNGCISGEMCKASAESAVFCGNPDLCSRLKTTVAIRICGYFYRLSVQYSNPSLFCVLAENCYFIVLKRIPYDWVQFSLDSEK